MSFVTVPDPYVKPAKISAPKPTRPLSTADLSPIDGLIELDSLAIDGGQLETDGPVELTIDDCHLEAFDLSGASGPVEITGSVVDRCDLSGADVRTIRRSRLGGVKLVGTELSGAHLSDVVFENCSFRYANLRMATLERVCFRDCVIDDVDLFEATIRDVEFPGSTIDKLNIDRLDATRADLREASSIGFSGATSLRGLLVSEEQLPSLMYLLANLAGLDVENTPEPS